MYNYAYPYPIYTSQGTNNNDGTNGWWAIFIVIIIIFNIYCYYNYLLPLLGIWW